MKALLDSIDIGNNRSLDFSRRALVMGIVNCTPDSFYPSSRKPGRDDALCAAQTMIDAGADIIDIGGESTRPGSDAVGIDEETRRVVPVIHAIRQNTDVPISIDTRNSAVARVALDAGADMVNDVSGLTYDQHMAGVVFERGVPIIIMHMRDTPKTMQENPHFEDPLAEVKEELETRVAAARSAGIQKNRIIIDPGIGFGKRLEDNLSLIQHLGGLKDMGFPVLVGISRKSFIQKVLDRDVENRLAGTLAAEAVAVLHGADILRVHDVKETLDLVTMLAALKGS